MTRTKQHLIPALALALAMALVIAPGAIAETYRWTDENGLVHYSNRPNQAPASARQAGPDEGPTFSSAPSRIRIVEHEYIVAKPEKDLIEVPRTPEVVAWQNEPRDPLAAVVSEALIWAKLLAKKEGIPLNVALRRVLRQDEELIGERRVEQAIAYYESGKYEADKRARQRALEQILASLPTREETLALVMRDNPPIRTIECIVSENRLAMARDRLPEGECRPAPREGWKVHTYRVEQITEDGAVVELFDDFMKCVDPDYARHRFEELEQRVVAGEFLSFGEAKVHSIGPWGVGRTQLLEVVVSPYRSDSPSDGCDVRSNPAAIPPEAIPPSPRRPDRIVIITTDD